jgi:hypothetical protein
MNGTIKDFFKLYFPADLFKKAWSNAVAFFCPCNKKAEIHALESTINYLEKRQRIIHAQLIILNLELGRKKTIEKLD